MPQVPALYRLPQNEVAPIVAPRMNAGYQPSGLEYVGKGLSDVADMFQRVQLASNVTEGHHSAKQTDEQMSAAIRQASLDYPDANEFEQAVKDNLNTIKQNSLASASNSHVRQFLSDSIDDNWAKHNEAAIVIKYNKISDKAKGNFILSKQQLLNSAMAEPPGSENLSGVYQQFGDLVGVLHATGVFDNERAKKELESFSMLHEQGQAEQLIMNGNPQQYLSNVAKGEYPHIPILTKNDLTKNAITMSDRLDKIREQQIAANQKAAYRAALPLADKGKLTHQDVVDLENTDAIDGTQAKVLYGRVGEQIQFTEPGTVRDIMTKLNLGEISRGTARKELANLYQRAPKDPNIASALQNIDNQQRSDIAAGNAAASRQRADTLRNYDQAVRELDQTPYGSSGTSTVGKHYRSAIIPNARNKYSDVLEELKTNMLDKKVSREDALKRAKDRLLPSTQNPTRQDKVKEFVGE